MLFRSLFQWLLAPALGLLVLFAAFGKPSGQPAGPYAGSVVYFASLGFGFITLELALLQHLNMRQHLYGYVGLRDNSMTPLVRPGSFVQIDDTQTKISNIAWNHEYERPIFFVELRDGYACSWCDLQGKQLFLIPHPLSGYPIRQFAYPAEADVVGRVTAVAMRLYLNDHTNLDRLPEQPEKS